MECPMRSALSLLVLLVWAALATSQTLPIIVELPEGSALWNEWKQGGRQGRITALSKLLGEHTTSPYILSSTLTCVENARQQSAFAKQRIDATIDRLERYAVITLLGPRDPALMAAKLRQSGLVSTAQVLPEQKIVGQPNDPEVPRQYYLPRIDVYRAWDVLPAGSQSVVAIIDTGVDTTHIDLQGSIWRNPAETGRDTEGFDKRTNGKDDDGNGFVDDWMGWDFVGRDGSVQDNMPLPGNDHGTHVGGIVAAQVNNATGIAGVARQVQLLPVKVGRDDVNSESVARTGDAILYAAAMGADVINCSFGSSSPTFADADVIRTATQLGSLVVGAAGNDGLDQAFYPAAHPEAVSVAASDFSDRLASFSNFHSTVDLCAPGVGILSTIPGNSYTPYNGTSMAAPVVSAVAAMVRQCFPTYSPAQIRAALVASCEDIDTLNADYIGKFGMGRVNAYRACSAESTRWCVVARHTFTDVDADGIFRNADTLELRASIRNVLNDLTDARVELQSLGSSLVILDSSIALGALRAGQERDLPRPLRFRLGQDLSDNARVEVRVRIYDDGRLVGSDVITAIANPTYATLDVNDIATTVNSSGNIGYNDYSANEQGVGFRYKDSPSLLFEGALMIGTGPTLLPNVARGVETSLKDTSFSAALPATLRTDSVISGARVVTAFRDDPDADGLGLAIAKNVYARTEDTLSSSILVVLNVTNGTTARIDNIYAAYFFDFDLGSNGADNVCAWDTAVGAFVQRNVLDATQPRIAMTMISPLPLNGFAIDNDGAFDCPSIYDNFLSSEKWLMMSQGLKRRFSNRTDASTVIGAGPFSLDPNASQTIAWIIAAGTSRGALQSSVFSARNAAAEQGIDVAPYESLPSSDAIIHVGGSPLLTPGATDIIFTLTNPSNITLDVIDITGRPVSTLYTESNMVAGNHRVNVNLPEVAQGAYFIRLTTERTSSLFGIGMVR
ncbi:MAG: T9SS type A sorting domain-containing protein [Candidatus Kapabacteria bacterium]|nr:T9SS type A sorting domain-containing protein [Candidatus Kapabacteria bacterium]